MCDADVCTSAFNESAQNTCAVLQAVSTQPGFEKVVHSSTNYKGPGKDYPMTGEDLQGRAKISDRVEMTKT